MNGDNNGTMGETADTTPSDQQSTPNIEMANTQSMVNGNNCENSNHSNDDNSNKNNSSNATSQDLNNVEHDPLEDCQGSQTEEPSDLANDLQDIEMSSVDNTSQQSDRKLNNILHSNNDNLINDNSNSSSPEIQVSQNNVRSEESIERELLRDSLNHSLGLTRKITSNTNNKTQPERDYKNGIETNNKTIRTDETEEDIVEDTITSVDIEKDADILNKIKLENEHSNKGTLKVVAIDRIQSNGEHDTDYSGYEGDLKTEDTVSIDSDSADDLHDTSAPNKSDDSIITIDNNESDQNGIIEVPIVHEITSDSDEIGLNVEDKSKETKKFHGPTPQKIPKGIPIMPVKEHKVELRRSSRTIKRKKYNDDIQPIDEESDIEEVYLDDSSRRKSKSYNSKSTVHTQSKKSMNQKKDNSIVIIDSPISGNMRMPSGNKLSALNQNICQTISSRGTSVTPITVKSTNNQSTQATQISTVNQPILPTLTDDMFVVEAPSFIVPYVYEKPAKVPFKEFIDKWGKELEEEKAKEEALLEIKKEETEKVQSEEEIKEKKEKDEEAEEMNHDEAKKKKSDKTEKRERRLRKKDDDDDDVSWDGSSSEESEDDIISDEDSQITIIKDKAEIIEEIKDISAISAISAVDPTVKSESYFDLFLGKFFMNIGINLVQEYVQTDLLKQQKRKLQREKRGGHDTLDRELSIALLSKNLELSQKTNATLTFEQKKCEFCTFKTESALALAHHLETPHMKNNLYSCNYCTFEIRSAHDILFHMDKIHAVKAKLERAPALHQCVNCPFEDHGKGKLARHQIACAKKFKPEINLAPPLEWEHPAKIAKYPRARPNMPPYQMTAHFGRNHVDGATGFTKVPIPIANAMPTLTQKPRNRNFQPRASVNIPVQMRPSGVTIRQAQPNQVNYPTGSKKPAPSISITPMPRQHLPIPVQPLHAINAKGFVICEICDGYIKDLEQLRNHMQWIHKVKIHPKMIYNRPPLNCQKCQFRFFTDQGLERHLLGSHGLVTSSMQDAANKGKDAGRCPVCGRVYQWKLLNHVSHDHNLILKPAHLSYKCTVCTATFGMYRQFESHVYSAHSVVAKKAMDKKTTATAKANANDNAAKQLKINDEITITPQPAKATPSKEK